MKTFIIKKWVEPYRLLEYIKKFYDYQDYTFDGNNKIEQKNIFLQELKMSKFNVGLYMKNVNKFYLFKQNNFVNIEQNLCDEFLLKNDDFDKSDDINNGIALVDIAKAEAVVLLN